MKTESVLLAAGGTGGHLFPAEAVATELVAANISVYLATDQRGIAYGGSFPPKSKYVISSATFSRASLGGMAVACFKLIYGFVQSLLLLLRIRPAVVVGFGGYPSIPPLVAAACLGIPTVLHEQNCVLGRANRFLGRFVKRIGTGFDHVDSLPDALKDKIVTIGNPVRSGVIDAAQTPFLLPAPDQKFHILVTGGSQGAQIMSQVVPKAVAALPKGLCNRLTVTHQARGDDIALSETTYREASVQTVVKPFFADLPHLLAQSHLVIARSGASTVSELAVIGRPSILVPLPGAIDQDQAANAAVLASRGAAIVIKQSEFRPESLAQKIEFLIQNGDVLQSMAAAAKDVHAINAAERLASLIMSLGKLNTIEKGAE